MQHRPQARRRHLAALGALVLASLAGSAAAQTTNVTYAPHIPPTLPQFLALQQPPPAAIPAVLRLPPGPARVPAVVILHGSGGVDGRGERYAQQLLAAGIGSLEIDMFTPRNIGRGQGVAARPRQFDTLPDVFGAARFLAANPRVDPQRIGVMGLSYGAGLSIMASIDSIGRAYAAGGADFRAAAPLYPVCFNYDPDRALARLPGQNFPRVAMLMLVGERDDYDADGGASCRRLAGSGSAAAQARMQFAVLPGATHMWDTERTTSYRDPAAARGQGGAVQVVQNRAAAEEGYRRVVAFFQQSLGR
jgi:dienelactone hydrolase